MSDPSHGHVQDIRKSGQCPHWIGEGVWADLSSAWATPEFIKMREQNKQNIASDCGGLGSSLHTGGSVPHTEHRRRLRVDEKAKKAHDDFVRARESHQSTGEGSSSGSAHTFEYHTWSDVVDGRQRGQIYGLGLQGYAYESSSSTSAFYDPSGAEETNADGIRRSSDERPTGLTAGRTGGRHCRSPSVYYRGCTDALPAVYRAFAGRRSRR
ncbi:uncharacterized protein LOC110109062 [Dendrobium catenatum]|uniref:uncharacterized protein LOC110109062 n=1 Tax=Dendrobium catenatum TaxID=906689 RepID=UPI0009F6B1A4|nr:uncharacterized protein LOC110109062 [Dendrobium catenatum]